MSQPASAHDGALPLAGLLVVSVEQAVAAPFASRHLADLGARVIKIERPDGGDFARDYDHVANGNSSFFVWLNRGKESVVADLKEPSDRAMLDDLVARADVFIQNLSPRAAVRLGLDARSLAARHPRLVACSMSGYGEGGPYDGRKAYDLLIQCEAGLVAATGTPEAPAKAGIPVADISCGMYAITGILTALYERERTGNGAAITVSLFDALSEWMAQPALYAHYSGVALKRSGAAHASISPYGPFETFSGQEINIAVQNEREWRVLCADVLILPDLANDPRFITNTDRVRNRDALDAVLRPMLRRMEADDLIRRLLAANIAFGVMRTAADLIDHAQHVDRDRWMTVDTPSGPVAALKPAVLIEGRELAMGAVPALGAHTAAVRAWLAYGDT